MGTLSGIMGLSSAASQAAQTKASAQLQAESAAETAVEQAQAEREAYKSAISSQKTGYAKSGVDLSGSALYNITSTRLKGEKNVSRILESGGSAYASAITTGSQQAKSIMSSARSNLISGIGSDLTFGVSSYIGGK